MALSHEMLRRVNEFDKENGESVQDQPGWLLFPTGAIREVHPEGALRPPPADPYKRAKLQARYHEVLVERAEERFHHLKQNLLARAETFSDLGEAEAALKHAKQIVTQERAVLKAARQRVARAKPEGLRIAERAAAEEAAETDNYIAKIDRIKI